VTGPPVTGPPVIGRSSVAVARAVAARPYLWPTAVSQVARLARPGWWRRWPPLPEPDPEYLRFRARTAYGDADHPLAPSDVVSWLEWCRAARRREGAGSGRQTRRLR
jgi:hypothetical protein